MLTDSRLRAILFDVGGPIVDETPDFPHSLGVVSGILKEELGRDVADSEVEKARESAIASWSPSFTKSVLWHFLKPDRERTQAVYRETIKRMFTHRDDVTLMDGIDVVIPKLAAGYKLALAGNQPVYIKEKLDRTGLMKYFESTVLSVDLGLDKPDSRFFIEICSRINEAPGNCCMIGDRLDNDIYPANILGMRTVWIRTGPHAVQHPRIPEDVPDATIENMLDLLEVIENWEK